ncbi:MAG: hypothetical protein IJ546_10495 [Prevotella sp.]|nr:hypothetical protein [Prevotella sp.]MBQ8468098.1 hypothetical protein [Prevotella sp.]
MKKSILSISILLAGLFLGACSSDDEKENTSFTVEESEAVPSWQMDWSYNQERPDWQAPQASDYENWAVLLVKMEDALQPYISDDDMMAVFVEGELRSLASPAINLGSEEPSYSSYFLLKVYGNETQEKLLDIKLCYYNSRLRHIFTRTAQINYQPDEIYGVDEDIIPQFTLGAEKYPVVINVQVDGIIAKAGLTPAEDDICAAFVGDECLGVASLTIDNSTMTIFGHQQDEVATLKYYRAEEKKIYTFPDAVKISDY